MIERGYGVWAASLGDLLGPSWGSLRGLLGQYLLGPRSQYWITLRSYLVWVTIGGKHMRIFWPDSIPTAECIVWEGAPPHEEETTGTLTLDDVANRFRDRGIAGTRKSGHHSVL